MQEQREKTVHQLAALAKQSEMNTEIDWQSLPVTEDELFLTMANNVIEQIESVPEDQRAVVSMATITKLLVENFAITVKMQNNIQHGE